VEHAGFKKFIAEDVELVATADRRVDVKLEVGTVADSVTVTSGAQLIETERATISDVKSNQVFTYMPINANFRSVWRMLQLTPGLNGSLYAGNGQGRNATFSIDGMPVRDGWTGNSFGPALTYLDSYRELRTDMVSVNASGGTSAQVAVVSESGTNTLHGEAWLHYNAIGFQVRTARRYSVQISSWEARYSCRSCMMGATGPSSISVGRDFAAARIRTPQTCSCRATHSERAISPRFQHR
jgi:hypothetical protein